MLQKLRHRRNFFAESNLNSRHTFQLLKFSIKKNKVMSIIILAIQIALFSLATAQESIFQGDPNTLWFRVIPEHSPIPSEPPCLVRSKPVVRRDDYTYTPGIGGHKVHTNAVKWSQARRICEDEGGHLAIINSVAESKALSDLWKNAGTVYGGTGDVNYALIGFHDLFEENEFITLHGQTIAAAGFTKWEAGEPNNAGIGEHCGAINKGGELNDNPCYKMYAFICEVPDVQ